MTGQYSHPMELLLRAASSHALTQTPLSEPHTWPAAASQDACGT